MKDEITAVFKKSGFVSVGFLNRRDALLDDFFLPWLNKGYHADMKWMEKNLPIRRDPCSIEDYGRSVITLAYPYRVRPPENWGEKSPISSYAWGEDYHKVLKKKLKRTIAELQTLIPEFKGRAFVDSAPLPEKPLAAKSGLGWIGKNSLLINQRFGSRLFLAEIVCNLDLASTPPAKYRCGECRLCVDRCPTQAIKPGKEIDSRLCLSYLTIEKRGEFTPKEAASLDYQLFGCDICQRVCPWNEKAPFQENSPFNCHDKWLDVSLEELAELKPDQWELLKQKSPLKRAKLEGVKRNAQTILRNQKKNIKL